MGAGNNGEIESDWSYVYFVVPSAVSFLCSTCLLIYIFRYQGFQKQFYQFTGVFIFFDIIQCASWFLGPRYHTNGMTCRVQEYMYQFGGLGKAFHCVVITGCVQFALKFGRNSMRSSVLLGWYSLCGILVVISICLRTADIFCPFDTDHELYYVKYDTSSQHFKSIVGYFCVIILPAFACFALNIVAIVIALTGTRKFNIPKVQEVVYKLRIVPILFFVCMVPIAAFFLVTVFAGVRVRALLQFGGASMMSCGWIFAALFFAFHKYEPKDSLVRRIIGSESKKAALMGSPPLGSDISPIIIESELVRSSEARPKPASSFMSSEGVEEGFRQSSQDDKDEEYDYFISGSWK
jgi:hypothetical protein